jgi:hypothetical protein
MVPWMVPWMVLWMVWWMVWWMVLWMVMSINLHTLVVGSRSTIWMVQVLIVPMYQNHPWGDVFG